MTTLHYREIKYRPKYELTAAHQERLRFVRYARPPRFFQERGILIEHINGATFLTLKKGYAWDGASGPTFDSENSQRASAVHDALYFLIVEGVLSPKDQKPSDKEFLRILRDDGMSFLRRRAWYRAVRRFGKGHAKPKEKKNEAHDDSQSEG